MSNATKESINGILLLDKPQGLSSNQALQKVKRLFNAKKAGHTGSLDPLATGLLPIAFGEATKFNRFMLEAKKTYWVEAQLGSQTSTADQEGDIVAQKPVPVLNLSDVRIALNLLLGQSMQSPPMYSALKINGQTLYKLARQGVVVERLPRAIEIFAINLHHFDPLLYLIKFEVTCSKGTYIRTLVESLADKLNTLGYLKNLRRLEHGPFKAKDMIDFSDLITQKTETIMPMEQFLLPIDAALTLPILELQDSEALVVQQGKSFKAQNHVAMGWCALYQAGQFMGVGEFDSVGELNQRRLLRSIA